MNLKIAQFLELIIPLQEIYSLSLLLLLSVSEDSHLGEFWKGNMLGGKL